MELEQFDDLTRRLSGAGFPRRQARRALGAVLFGSALAGVAARLGLAEIATAKPRGNKRKAKPKRPSNAEQRAQGQLQTEGKRKGKKGKKKPPKPPRPTPCGPNLKPCPDGSCIATSACCPGSKPCGSEGCIPANECCEFTAPLCGECKEPVCDSETGEYACRDSCPAGFTCCNGLCEPPCDNGCLEEPSRACLCERPPEGMKYCAAEHVCVTLDECCPNAVPPSCGECEEVACEGGELVCEPKSGCCPAGRARCQEGCCPEGYWCHQLGSCCTGTWGTPGFHCTCPSGYSTCAGRCCKSCCGGVCCAGG
jgi:hypothetical protein